MGLVEVARHLPRLLRRRRELLARWTETPPDVFVGVDAPDFNLGLARRLRARGVKTVHYVCPSVWAWRENRVKTLKRSVDHILCLLPFEPKFLSRHALAATFVGHPLATEINANADREAARRSLGLAEGPLLAVLPGSRGGEVGRLAAPFVETLAWLQQRLPKLKTVAALAGPGTAAQFTDAATAAAVSTELRIGATRTVLEAADVVLVASGTAALETALHGKPMVVAYRLNTMTHRLVTGLNLIKSRYISLPNILADDAIVPECLQDDVRADVLGPLLLALLTDPAARAEQTAHFATLAATLSQDADVRSAAVVASMLDPD